jgi:hypothetical protein
MKLINWLLILSLTYFAACGSKQQSDDSDVEDGSEWPSDVGPPPYTPTPGVPVPSATPLASCTDDARYNQTVEITGAFLQNNVIPSNLTITITSVKNGVSSQYVAHANDYKETRLLYTASLHKISYTFNAFGTASYKITVAASGIPTLSTPQITVSSADQCHADAHLSRFQY